MNNKKNPIHPNYIVDMVAKYWPDCINRPLMVALSGPESGLRTMLVSIMKRNGATDIEIAAVYDYYYYMDESMKIDIQ